MQHNRTQPETRRYRVARKDVNSENITSFYLKPLQGSCPKFVPGDYLVFEVTDGDATLKREYSISKGTPDYLRVTVKREDAPKGKDVPEGKVSGYFHATLREGDEISAFGPTGNFALNQASSRPVVLLGGGVGQTPLMAMAHALAAEGKRDTVIVHACEHGGVHALGSELKLLKGQCARVRTHVLYATPRPKDRMGIDYDSAGFVTLDLLKNLIPSGEVEFYLCGPGPFMEAMYSHLTHLGVDDDLIHYEFFGPATLLKPRKNSNPSMQAPTEATDQALPKVTFTKSNLTLPWDPAIGNLLEFAEEAGVMADYSCRAGTCDTCKTRLIAGNIAYVTPPMDAPDEEHVLLCCATPDGDITLEL